VVADCAVIEETLDLVLFSAGGWRVGLEARWVCASRHAPAQTTGCEIEAFLGFASAGHITPAASRQYLQLKRVDGSKDILVGSPVELFSLPASAIHPLPPLLAARTGLRGLRAIALPTATGDKAVVLLFDASCLPVMK
jgi:hypothetical protein